MSAAGPLPRANATVRSMKDLPVSTITLTSRTGAAVYCMKGAR